VSFAPYPRYKDWLGPVGAVPEHWKLVPLKAVVSHNDEVLDETTPTDKEILYVDIAGVDGVAGVLTKESMLFGTAPSRARRRVKDGDVLVSTVRTYLRAIVSIRQPEDNLVVSTGFAVLRSRGELISGYLGYVLSANYFVDEVIARSTGVSYPAINASELVAIPVAIPSCDEQLRITAFLDAETAKIDALVAEQKRLIELLMEKRHAVISHAVTKGLNPDASMKPSGVEWLGDVPNHWQLIRMRFLCDIQTGSRDTENAVEDGQYPFFVRSQTVERIDTAAFDCEAVLTAGDGAGVGKVFHYFSGPFDFHQRVYMLNNFRQIGGRFLFLFLKENFFKVALAGGAKSTVDSLRRPMLTNFWVCVPPIEEQANIIDAIEHGSTRFDGLIAEAERAIALLLDRRTAVISAAVTGKIDVRGYTVAEGTEAA